jgi:hypothetical protein
MTGLAVSPNFATDQTLIAGAEHRPLYISLDAGDNWSPLTGLPEEERHGAGMGLDQDGRIAPIATTPYGVYKYVWPEITPLSPQVFRTSAGPTEPTIITRQVTMMVDGSSSPGNIMGESADWLEITPISGTLPIDFNFIFDTSQLVDKLETTITADVYWSGYDIRHYDIPVTLTRASQRTLLPLIRR